MLTGARTALSALSAAGWEAESGRALVLSDAFDRTDGARDAPWYRVTQIKWPLLELSFVIL